MGLSGAYNDFDLEPLAQKMPKDPPTELNPLEFNAEDPLADLRQGAEGLVLPEENMDSPFIPTAFTGHAAPINKHPDETKPGVSSKHYESDDSDEKHNKPN